MSSLNDTKYKVATIISNNNNNINNIILMLNYILLIILIIVIAIIYLWEKKIHNLKISGGEDIIEMAWNNSQEYTKGEADEFINIIKKNVYEFTPLTPTNFRNIRDAIDPKWNDDQIIATWHLLTTQMSLRSSKRLDTIPDPILFGLNADNLVSTSKKYKVPTLPLIKRSLKVKGYTKSVIDNWLNEPKNITDEEMWKLVVKGWETDPENPTTFKIIFDKSREYEIEIENMLKETGIKFKTQEDLVKEQIEEYGRPVITPDILFDDPVVIIVSHPDGTVTDHKVHWIDAKNYMFLGATFITKSVAEQTKRYVQEFGTGALLFHYGFVNSGEFPGAVMLSGGQENKFIVKK
jgi:hypothetical protein